MEGRDEGLQDISCSRRGRVVCGHSRRVLALRGGDTLPQDLLPSKFTVEEASMAAEVELIKVLLISLPLVIVIAAALYILRTGIKDKSP
jgi:hypothetical protein